MHMGLESLESALNSASFDTKSPQCELSQLCHVTKNNHLIIFTTVYYGLLGGHFCVGALVVRFMNCPPNSN